MKKANGWSEYQKLVLARLDDLKESQDKSNKFLFEHVQSNNKDFEAIRLDIATNKAVHEASAAGKAKFWAAIGGGVSLLAGIIGDWFLFGRK